MRYEHPSQMKLEEEKVAAWSEKRLEQLNFLFLTRKDHSTITGADVFVAEAWLTRRIVIDLTTQTRFAIICVGLTL